MTTSSLGDFIRSLPVFFLGAALLCLASCDSPGAKIQKIRSELNAFKKEPCDARLEALEKSFAEMDAIVKDLEQKEDFAQADLFRRQAKSLHYEFVALRKFYLEWRDGPAANVVPEQNGSDASGKGG
ncbi:MAG: hypothetical protein WCG66_01410 [bacterium]